MAPQHEAAAGVAIEPMSERRRVRQTGAQFVKPAFEIGSAARAGMHGDPRRLVDHEDQPITIEHALGKAAFTSQAPDCYRRLRFTLFPRRPGGEGRVGGVDQVVCGAAHLTLPGARVPGPLPLPPEGWRGAVIANVSESRQTCARYSAASR